MTDRSPGKLAREASKRGYENVAEMIEAALEKEPSMLGAAVEINVTPNALSVWLRANGYMIVREVKARLVRAESMGGVTDG